MSVGLDERVVGRDHRQTRGGHSEVEAKADHYVRSKGRSVNGAGVSRSVAAVVHTERGPG